MKLTSKIMLCGAAGMAAVLITAPSVLSQPPGGGGRGLRGSAQPFDYNSNEGWTSLFDGKTLNGWSGNTSLWSVKDGSLYIHPSCEQPTGTTYIHWTGGEPGDFALKYELKGNGQVNGGMQFRSYMTADANVGLRYPAGRAGGGGFARGGSGGGRGPGGGFGFSGGAFGGSGRAGGVGRGPACANPGTVPPREQMAPYDMNGPQADFDAGNSYSGMFYEQGGRAIIATPGYALLAEQGKPVQILSMLADKVTLDSWFHKDDFNQFMIVAKGNTTSIYMNSHLITVLIDNDPAYFRPAGKIGPEVESTGEYWVRNIYLKPL